MKIYKGLSQSGTILYIFFNKNRITIYKTVIAMVKKPDLGYNWND